MATQVRNSPISLPWAARLREYSLLATPVAIVLLLSVIIVPLSPILLDLLIVLNLSLSAVILLTTLYVKSPLDFSVFPSLLLATTLFRLVLNVASTRLILSADAATPAAVVGVAGQVIQQFAQFVTSGSEIVGFIIFVILIIVQFVVITKGATRISEVAARFTLDAMPGKQMAIDADLNAGIINEQQAKQRREDISREADFYGAMDGASKFVRGDAIAGIIITLINIIGGFAIGVGMKGWPALETLQSFTKLTIGDGLITQIPSLIVSIASGLIVTRSSSKSDLSVEFSSQLTSQPMALGITAIFLGALSFTGLPMFPLMAIASVVGATAWFTSRPKTSALPSAPAGPPEPPPIETLLSVDTMELEVGYSLVELVDRSRGGNLLDRIALTRRQLASEMGLVIPPVRIRDNMQLQPNEYHIKIRGNSVAQGVLHPRRFLAMNSGMASGQLDGEKTREPAFGLEAWWIDSSQRERAETANFTVVDASSVLATHLTEVVKTHADELLTREETGNLIAQLKEKSPKLVEEVVPTIIKPGDLQRVLQGLLRERVPIRDMEVIIETLGNWAVRTKDIDVLIEYVRNGLRRTICAQYVEIDAETGKPRLFCVTSDPAMEDLIIGYIDRTEQGTTMSMDPAVANRITAAIIEQIQKLIAAGHHPVVLASPQVRAQVRQLLEPHLPNVAVLGYNEVSKGVEVESVGMAQVDLAQFKSVNGARA